VAADAGGHRKVGQAVRTAKIVNGKSNAGRFREPPRIQEWKVAYFPLVVLLSPDRARVQPTVLEEVTASLVPVMRIFVTYRNYMILFDEAISLFRPGVGNGRQKLSPDRDWRVEILIISMTIMQQRFMLGDRQKCRIYLLALLPDPPVFADERKNPGLGRQIAWLPERSPREEYLAIVISLGGDGKENVDFSRESPMMTHGYCCRFPAAAFASAR
jgi:hypothetical protein